MTMQPTRRQLAALASQLAATAAEEIDCDAVLDRIGAYLEATRGSNADGGASESAEALAPELASVAQHLSICPTCLEEFEALLRAMDENP